MIPRTLFLGATLAVALAPSGLVAQAPSRIFSRPELPSAENLRRLNLVINWNGYVPMDGRRDGLLRAGIEGDELIVLTRSGLVTLLDAGTGEVRWRTRVGKPYTILPFYAANSRTVYVIANAIAFALDRATGTKKWEYPLRAGISAGPVVDEERIYVPTSTTRLFVYYLPFAGLTRGRGGSESAIYDLEGEARELRPRPIWEEQTNIQLFFRPLQTPEELFVVSPSGKGIGYSKVLKEGATSTEIYQFNTEGKIRVPPAQHVERVDAKTLNHIAYIGSDDGSLYAINLVNGRLRWRYTAGNVFTRPPIPVGDDLYVTTERDGLARVNRLTGESVWRVPFGRQLLPTNTNADRFLAANDRFVYANDHSGRLLVLDRRRGTQLSMFDTTAFRFPIVNDVTDRLFLAANDGLIMCLRDRDQVRAIRHRAAEEEIYAPVSKLLEQLVTDPGEKQMSLRVALANLRTRYGIHTVIALDSFKVAGNPNVQDKLVMLPKAEKRPLKDHLQRILSLADARYQIEGRTIIVLPAKPAEKNKK